MHYLINNPVAKAVLRCIDACLLRAKKHTPTSTPKRVLICNIAHLGDVVIATSVLPVLRQAFPHAQLGFLAGSWSKLILEKHPLVDFVHCVDHWKLNRSHSALWKKFWIYVQTRSTALKEIRALKYDCAVDLYVYFPNCSALLWQAAIPVRLGYTSGGFGPLYTHRLEWQPSQDHLSIYHLKLIQQLPTGVFYAQNLRPTLAPICADAQTKTPKTPFVIFHLGPPSSRKAWPTSKWRALTHQYADAGHKIVFTGHGADEYAHIEQVKEGVVQSINLCNQLSWEELVACIGAAKQLVTIDSVPMHIADALGTPVVVLFCGINEPTLLRPQHTSCRLLMQNVACAPCHQKQGCSTMACIREIAVSDVGIE
jgi:ADP-heptose:LPS heptosyltransferase